MLNWLILACFIGIGFSDWKRRIIPDSLLIIIAVLSLIGRTRIEIYEHIGIGLACGILGFILYKARMWSWGDVKLAGVVGLAFGLLTPYVALLASLTMITYQGIKKDSAGLPFGVPVALGAMLATILSVL